jgi:hypothetical protein
VAGNELTGKLPACLTSMEKLEEINIFGNGISGSLPSGLLFMPEIRHLVFSNNQLSGGLDVLFDTTAETESLSAFHTLETLKLDNNMFTGEPPGKLFFVRELTTLTLHENMLTGNLDVLCGDDEDTDSGGDENEHIFATLTADCLNDVVRCTCCTECN